MAKNRHIDPKFLGEGLARKAGERFKNRGRDIDAQVEKATGGSKKKGESRKKGRGY